MRSRPLRLARIAFRAQAIEHLRERLVWLGAEDQVSAAEDMGRYRVDPNGLRLAPAVVEQCFVLALLDGVPELGRIQADRVADTHEVIEILEPAGPLPVRLEQGPVHAVELAMLARKLRGAQRSPRVDDHVTLPHQQADLGGDSLEPPSDLTGSRASEVGLEWDSLDRRLRMELERQPSQMDKTFLFEAFDPDRVDVAPGSNIVGEDHQIGWGCVLAHCFYSAAAGSLAGSF